MWKKIKFKESLLSIRGAKASLINMPSNSSYAGYAFWHPNKLVRKRDYVYDFECNLSFTNEFVFKLFKDKKGYGKKRIVVDQIELSADEFADEFSNNLISKERSAYHDIVRAKKIEEKPIIILEEFRNE